jgi:hypothetical protein
MPTMEITVRDGLNQQQVVATNDAVIAQLIEILTKLPETEQVMSNSSTVTAVAEAATVLIGATSRKGVLVFNEGPERVFIRENNTAAKSPLVIGAGGVLPIYLSQALWVYNPGLENSALYIAELV